jgi:telomerase protein component 1
MMLKQLIYLFIICIFLQITQKLKSLPHTTPILLQEVLSRLESDLGQDLVSTAISLLVCSRNGQF